MNYVTTADKTQLYVRAVLYMQRGQVFDIDSDIALAAASNGLPVADSLIYASAQAHGATVWTQDAHFDGLAGALLCQALRPALWRFDSCQPQLRHFEAAVAQGMVDRGRRHHRPITPPST